MTDLVLAVTGHRPDKLGGYGEAAQDRVYCTAYDELKNIQPKAVITGMALGWDQQIAQACIDLKIEFFAYVPCDGQDRMWPSTSRLKYRDLLEKAEHVHVVSPGPYAAWKMQRRNEAMIDRCNSVLALWNGSSGGTMNAVLYAQRQKKPVRNCWERFVKADKRLRLPLVPRVSVSSLR